MKLNILPANLDLKIVSGDAFSLTMVASESLASDSLRAAVTKF
jgi:hypothetical protein